MDFISVIMMLSGLGKNKKAMKRVLLSTSTSSICFSSVSISDSSLIIWPAGWFGNNYVCFFSLAVFMSMLPDSRVCIFSSYRQY